MIIDENRGTGNRESDSRTAPKLPGEGATDYPPSDSQLSRSFTYAAGFADQRLLLLALAVKQHTQVSDLLRQLERFVYLVRFHSPVRPACLFRSSYPTGRP